MLLVFHRPTDVWSRLVAWWGRGKYSHVSIRFDKDKVTDSFEYEAYPGKGVSVALRRIPANADVYIVPQGKEGKAGEFLLSQVGKDYDWPGVFGFILKTRQQRKASNRWFCSELAAVACEINGTPLFDCDPWLLSPCDLAASPILKRVI